MTYFTVKRKPCFVKVQQNKLSRGPLHILSDPGRADYFELTLALEPPDHKEGYLIKSEHTVRDIFE